MLVIFAFIIAFAYFVITTVNKEAAVTAIQSMRGQSEGLAKVLAERRSSLQQLQRQRLAAEAEQKVLAESTQKLEALSASEEKERAALLDVQAKIHDTHKQYIASVRATVEGFIGTKTASILMKSGKTLANLTLSAATEESLTFSHDTGITKVLNADLADESRKLFGLPDHKELTQLLEEYRSAEQASLVPAGAGGRSANAAASSAEIAALEEQLAKVKAQDAKLRDSARMPRPEVPEPSPEPSLMSREAIAKKLNERIKELQTLIKNAKGQP